MRPQLIKSHLDNLPFITCILKYDYHLSGDIDKYLI